MIALFRWFYNLITGRQLGPQTSQPPLSTLETQVVTADILGTNVTYLRTFVLDDDSVQLQTADRALLIRLYRGGLRLEDVLHGKRPHYVRVTIDNRVFVYPIDIVESRRGSREGFMGTLTKLVLAHVSLMHPEEGKLLSQQSLDPRRWSVDLVDPA